jgi:hypothetical protein
VVVVSLYDVRYHISYLPNVGELGRAGVRFSSTPKLLSEDSLIGEDKVSLADLDNDGDLDLLCESGDFYPSEVHFNSGDATNPRIDPVALAWDDAQGLERDYDTRCHVQALTPRRAGDPVAYRWCLGTGPSGLRVGVAQVSVFPAKLDNLKRAIRRLSPEDDPLHGVNVTAVVGTWRPVYLDADGDGLIDVVGPNAHQYLANIGSSPHFPVFSPKPTEGAPGAALVAGG